MSFAEGYTVPVGRYHLRDGGNGRHAAADDGDASFSQSAREISAGFFFVFFFFLGGCSSIQA